MIRRACCRASLGALVVLFWAVTGCIAAQPRAVTVTDPWLSSITAFLGGPFLTVTSLESWSTDFKLERHRWNEATVLLALDHRQAKTFRLVSKNGTLLPGVRLVYECRPQALDDEAFYLDPARLPFVAQRVMAALTALEPNRYAFFQRRLAEFETRLTSTVLSGRSQLEGRAVWDLGGAYDQFWKAVGCQIQSAGPEALQAVESWLALSEAARHRTPPPWGEMTLVVDWSVPAAIRSRLKGSPNAVFLQPPAASSQPLFELHEIFLDVSLGGKTQPKKAK